MPQAPRIPKAEWQVHKALITDLWINQNKTLDEVMQHMAALGFCPSRPQWIRKINVNWNLRKNSTKEEWQHAISILSERKENGKETDLLMNGRIVPSKKRMKALKRYPTSQTKQIAPDSDQFRAVAVSTPPASDQREVPRGNLPSFHIRETIRNCICISDARELRHNRSSYVPGPNELLNDVESCILYEIDALENPYVPESVSRTIEKVDEMFPVLDVHRSKEQSQQPVWIQIFQALLLISTNNLWHDIKTSFSCLDYFLDLVLSTGHLEGLETLLIETKETNGKLATHLLFSALREDTDQNLELMRFLLDSGVYPNSTNPKLSVSSCWWTALHEAVYWDSQWSVSVLIEFGADPHPCLDTLSNKSALEIPREHLLDCSIRELPKAPGECDIFDGYGHRHEVPPLFQAIRNGSLHCAQKLLDAGVDPNYFHPSLLTALHCAIDMHDVGMVEMLIKAGALPDTLPSWEPIDSLGISAWAIDNPKTVFTPLQAAVRSKNLPIVRHLLYSGAKPDRVGTMERYQDMGFCYTGSVESCLQTSASAGNYVMMCLLLTSGANPNSNHKDTPTALQNVCGSASMSPLERYHAASLLLDHGADINASPATQGGRTALQAAVEVEDHRLVNLLLSEEADPNTPATSGGVTALEAAINSGSKSLKRLLVEKGVLVPPSNPENSENSEKSERRTLELAVSSGNITVMKSVFGVRNGPSWFLSDENVERAVKAAIMRENLDLVKRLSNIYPQVDRFWVLCETVWQEKYEILEGILSWLPPHIPNWPSFTRPSLTQPSPLWIALHQRNRRMVRRLLLAGADPSQMSRHICRLELSDTRHCPVGRYRNLELPIRQAIAPGHGPWEEDTEMVELLVSHGAQINCSANGKNSPLILALEEKKYKIAEFLLHKGANPNVVDNIGNPAIAYALRNANYSLVETFINHGTDATKSSPSWGSPILALATHGRRDGLNEMQDLAKTCQLLLSSGADVNAEPTSLSKMTALQISVFGDIPVLVDMFIEAGADIHAPAFQDYGYTALQAAAFTRNFKLAKRLVEMGVDINAPPAEWGGSTAFEYAAISGHINMATFLLEHGASINPAWSRVGLTALEGASQNGRLNMIHFLLKNDQDPDTVEERCQDSARLAEDEGFTRIATFLREYRRP
ncbi:ankyrin repeat-containing domain protein [Fusarium flagelliforme]|uniref:Clr5 domain-containing protein n=1 Tax=Fusarium flagelliforme TaxID=2675880 RepID=A0A395N4Q5_9HYPO|nr:ankyrin repeat-containing domain protein [Fusarium flagelliforme]KAH7191915.1 ankyrin repeat-containing domain protein [Fusarium flagelliforme]RFN55106.1 hypothetical protein FIE12Z_618 [Fusarium flagelliforme]